MAIRRRRRRGRERWGLKGERGSSREKPKTAGRETRIRRDKNAQGLIR